MGNVVAHRLRKELAVITSRTPLRISLCGGGTDVPAFYKTHGGAVVSFAISKYVYVSVNDKFDGRTRMSYSVTEDVYDPHELQHDLAREVLHFFQAKGLEITSVSDIPGEGSGLGSSTAFAVGLLTALSHKIGGKSYPCKMLAETAHTIEAKLCNHPGVGKQDMYSAAYGGLHYYEFSKGGNVEVQPIYMSPEQKEYLESHLILLWTGRTRQAAGILREQERNLGSNREAISAACKLRDMANDLGSELILGNFHKIGAFLDDGWKLKKRFSDSISDSGLDRTYLDAIAAGAVGGKLLGAGGGGFFLFFAEPKLHEGVRSATGLRQIPFKIQEKGSEIIYDSSQA